MNFELLTKIVEHIFASFLVINSRYITKNSSQSLMVDDFLLDKKVPFETNNKIENKNNMWSCQSKIADVDFKLLLVDCSDYSDDKSEVKDYALIIQLTGSPVYGLYYSYSTIEPYPSPEYHYPLIGFNHNNTWIVCNTFIQSTFLAGMEQLKDVNCIYTKCIEYKELYKYFETFMDFHTEFYDKFFDK